MRAGRGVHGCGDRGAAGSGGAAARVRDSRSLVDFVWEVPAAELPLPEEGGYAEGSGRKPILRAGGAVWAVPAATHSKRGSSRPAVRPVHRGLEKTRPCVFTSLEPS